MKLGSIIMLLISLIFHIKKCEVLGQCVEWSLNKLHIHGLVVHKKTDHFYQDKGVQGLLFSFEV